MLRRSHCSEAAHFIYSNKVYKAHTHTHTHTRTLTDTHVPINASQDINTLHIQIPGKQKIQLSCVSANMTKRTGMNNHHAASTVLYGHANNTHSIQYQGAETLKYRKFLQHMPHNAPSMINAICRSSLG